MPSKKHLDQNMTSQSVHKSRQAQIFGESSKATKWQHKQRNNSSTKRSSPSSVNLIKKKLRDVTRRLERSKNLPAGLRIEDERAKAVYLQELAIAESEKKKQRMIKKYHMVRFFERKKASRLLKKIRTQLSSADSPEAIDLLKKQMHEAEVDLNYTMYHPLSEVYVSLYPNTPLKSDLGDTRSVKQKPPIWTEIELAMETGTLDIIRNRVSIKPAMCANTLNKNSMNYGTKQPFVQTEAKYLYRQAQCREVRERKSQGACRDVELQKSKNIQNEGDDDSDGGFFE